ncbi:MAG: pgl [Parachlamydiales bacterium]|nr:pgl [Parachlamydiales bacterium]
MLTINPGQIQSIDDRRDAVILSTMEEATRYAVEHWVRLAKASIAERGRFAVALSGGSTPNAIYKMLASPPYSHKIDWSKVFLFWSDERSVSPDHPDSNYRTAMTHGFSHLPLFPAQIFRMEAEKEIARSAEKYESAIRKTLGPTLFDLVMLGLGEDGHTASLFPNTTALQENDRWVVANDVPEKKSGRMTLTIPCINQSWQSVFYVFGAAKQTIAHNVLRAPRISPWPASQIGTPERKSLWIMDAAAAASLLREQ